MGRGKVQLKRIDNKIHRQVTFSKRRNGLFKKAHEISVLCDADVALIIFSTRGKLFEYSTNSSMDNILEQYERYNCAQRELVAIDIESQGSWSFEYTKLKARIEILQRTQRNYLGEDLNPLSLKELQNLEQQLDTSLRQIRLRKNQLMFNSISEHQRKEKELREHNIQLQKKLKEKKNPLNEEMNWEQQNRGEKSSTILMSHPLPCLNINGTHQGRGAGSEDVGAQPQVQTNMPIPPWMIHHINK